MAAYRRVLDSRHRRLTAKDRDQLRNHSLGNRIWATFTFLIMGDFEVWGDMLHDGGEIWRG